MIANMQLWTTETIIKTSGVWAKEAVLSMIFCNNDTATRTITIYTYATWGTAWDSTTIIKSYSIPAGDSFIWSANEKFILENWDKISWICDVASKVTVTVNSLTI